MRQRLTALMTLGVTVLASGCSGGAGSPISSVPAVGKPQTGPAAIAKTKLTIRMPAHAVTANSKLRHTRYVSAGTNGLGVRTGPSGQLGGQDWQLFDVSGTSPLCTTSGGFRTCTVSVTAPVGAADEFQVDATDQAPLPTDTIPQGNPLSSGDSGYVGSTPIPIVAGQANPVSVTLTAVIGNLSMAAPSTVYSAWAAPGATVQAATTANIIAADYANDQIFGSPSTYENEITFTDNLSGASPFVYPVPSSTFLGVPPPATLPGTTQAPIAYTAPTTGTTGLSATVTVSTVIPSFLLLPTNPTTTFTINALVASVGGLPIVNVPNVTVSGAPVLVTINETGATSFTVAAPASANGSIALLSAPGVPLTGPIVANGAGTATFLVQGLTPTSNPPTGAPTITIVDASGTTATLNATVAP